jgi:hypothetical protein
MRALHLIRRLGDALGHSLAAGAAQATSSNGVPGLRDYPFRRTEP